MHLAVSDVSELPGYLIVDSSAVTHPLAYCVIMCCRVGIATPMEEEWYKAELSLLSFGHQYINPQHRRGPSNYTKNNFRKLSCLTYHITISYK